MWPAIIGLIECGLSVLSIDLMIAVIRVQITPWMWCDFSVIDLNQ